jgi:hypothetical protein
MVMKWRSTGGSEHENRARDGANEDPIHSIWLDQEMKLSSASGSEEKQKAEHT